MAITEQTVFECLSDNLRMAAEDCRKLAWHPKRGFVYDHMRRSLKLVEGACRQAYYLRDYDARWLYLGLQMEEAHKRAGNWVRDLASKDGRKVAHPLFQKLAEVLEKAHQDCERIRTTATGKIGPILPAPEPLHRETRPVQVKTPGGIILPATFRDKRAA